MMTWVPSFVSRLGKKLCTQIWTFGEPSSVGETIKECINHPVLTSATPRFILLSVYRILHSHLQRDITPVHLGRTASNWRPLQDPNLPQRSANSILHLQRKFHV